MGVKTPETLWFKNKLKQCNREREECRNKCEIISVDLMSWLVSRSECTWHELGTAFMERIVSYIREYRHCTHLYLSLDHCGRNNGKLMTQQQRQLRRSSSTSQITFSEPKLDDKFDSALFGNKKWRCYVLYQFLATFFVRHCHSYIVEAVTVVLHGVYLNDKSGRYFKYEIDVEETPFMNDAEIILTPAALNINIHCQYIRQYIESDQRQLFVLLNHPDRVCCVINNDGDTLSNALLYIAMHGDLNQILIWKFGSRDSSEEYAFHFDINSCYHQLHSEVSTQTWFTKDHNAAVIFTYALSLRGNDFVKVKKDIFILNV